MRGRVAALNLRLLLALLLMSPVLSMSDASYASITNTRLDAFGTEEVASGGWMNHSGVPVYSNGSSPNLHSPATTNQVYNINSVLTDTGYEWQCVEHFNRLYLTEGWTTSRWTGNGNQIYDNTPANITKEAQGSISYLQPGDVITMDDGGVGHVDVIDTVTKSGSSYTIQTANQNTDAVFLPATLTSGSITLGSGFSGSLTVTGVSHAPTRMMIIDGSSHAYSEDFLRNSWTSQITNATITAVAVGGSGRMMAMNSSGTVYSKDYPTASWVTQVASGAKAIAVGGKGRMMVIDSANNVYAKDGTTDSWTPETTLGGITKIAVGGNGRQMLIDTSNTAYYEDVLGNSWSSQVTGAKAIAVGGNGRMMVINSADNAYAADSSGGWTAETGSGGVTAIAVGGNGRQMIMDTTPTAYSQDNIGTSWTTQLGSVASAIAVGSNGRLVTIDTNGKARGKDHPTDSWTDLTANSGAAKIVVNNE